MNATADDLAGLTFREVTRARLEDVVALFESRGGPKNCWCMVWRATPAEAKKTDGASRKAALIGRVKRGEPVGILGYLDGRPIAWCSIAPRPTYRELGGPAEEVNENIWSLVCFFVTRAYRGQGLTARLLEAAIDHARRKGATLIEAYPVDPTHPATALWVLWGRSKKRALSKSGGPERAGM